MATKKIAIHQPNYFPWLGYFYKIHQSDVFVFLDDVQYSNEGMHNYHYIKTSQGRHRLKVPVHQSFGMKINEVKTKEETDWKKKHLRTIQMNYAKAPYYNSVFQDYQSWLQTDFNGDLTLFDKLTTISICDKLGIDTEFILSSELNVQGQKEDKVINICKALNGNIYFSGTGAMAYQDENRFRERGMKLEYSMFRPFEYPQLWGEFDKNVSVLDFLMNCGYDWERVMEHQEV